VTPGDCILIKAEPATVPLFVGSVPSSDSLAPPVCSLLTILFASLEDWFFGRGGKAADSHFDRYTDTHVGTHAQTHTSTTRLDAPRVT